MATPQSQLKLTPEQYLAFEREAEERHEYDNGRIQAMAGESPKHSTINFNLMALVGAQIRGGACRGFSPNMKVEIGAASKFYYPDLAIVCGHPQFHDGRGDVLTNPQVICEILSPSTERKDRTQKLLDYQQFASLTDYLLIAQEQPLTEHFTKREDGQWTHEINQGLEASVDLASIDCGLDLAEIYDRVEFPSQLTPKRGTLYGSPDPLRHTLA